MSSSSCNVEHSVRLTARWFPTHDTRAGSILCICASKNPIGWVESEPDANDDRNRGRFFRSLEEAGFLMVYQFSIDIRHVSDYTAS